MRRLIESVLLKSFPHNMISRSFNVARRRSMTGLRDGPSKTKKAALHEHTLFALGVGLWATMPSP